MASRVNSKFVVLLVGGVVVLFCGVAAASFWALSGRAEKNMRRGEAYLAAGNVKDAVGEFGKAVNRDRTNLTYLSKWVDAISKYTPENRAAYEEKYGLYYRGIEQLAQLQAGDGPAQVRFIKELDDRVRSGSVTREGLEEVIARTTDRIEKMPEGSAAIAALRAYRGMAASDRMALVPASEEERGAARADLEAAIAADPANWRARLGLARWHAAEGERLRRENRPDETAQAMAAGREVVAALLRDRPDHPEGLLARMLVEAGDRARLVATPEQARAAFEALKVDASALLEKLAVAPAGELRSDHVTRVSDVVMRVVGAPSAPALLGIVDAALKEHPKDPELLLTRGVVLKEKGDAEEALAQFQQVVDLPDVPVSLQGLLLPNNRLAALGYQVDTALGMWERTRSEADKASAALAKAKAYRDELQKAAGNRGRELLLLRDAQIAFAENRMDAAVRDLSELRLTGQGNSPQVFQLLAQALELQGNRGEAIRVLSEMTEKVPGTAWPYGRLGELSAIEATPQSLAEAERYFKQALELEPENTLYQDRLRAVTTALGRATEGADADPLVKAVMRSRELRDESKYAEALALIEPLYEKNPGARLLGELIQIDMREGKKDRAVARVNAALEKFPNNAELKQIKTRLEIEDPVAASLAIIDAADAPPVAKAVERFQVLLGAGRKDEAKASLAEAEKLDPNDQRVVDFAFVLALSERNFDKARELATRAAGLNLDQARGLMYQGRLQLVEGKSVDAVASFEQAEKQLPYSPVLRRLLGQAYQRVGRNADALRQFQLAYEGRTDDVASAREYAIALMNANRGKEALEVVKPVTGALRFAPNDQELLALWLNLEGRFGDRTKAIDARTMLLKGKPEDIANAQDLATILMDDQKWEQAKAVIDQIAANPKADALTVAALQGHWRARQGDFDAGKASLEAYVQTQPEKAPVADPAQKGSRAPFHPRLRGLVAVADFCLLYGKDEDAIGALEAARPYQDAARLEADRRLGDLYFDLANKQRERAMIAEAQKDTAAADELGKASMSGLEKALALYTSVLGSKPENPADLETVKLRAAETLMRLERYQDAEALLASLAAEKPDSMHVLLMQAVLADRAGDKRAARQRLDRAVQQFPSNPLPFLQRAQINSNEPELLGDVLKDLEQVNRLQPGQLNAWASRFGLLKRAKRLTEGFAVLRAGVEANPENDDLRRLLMRELAADGRTAEVQEEVLALVEKRPGETQFLQMAAGIMVSSNPPQWREASELYAKIYEIEKTPDNAKILMDSMLRPGLQPAKSAITPLLTEFEKVDDEASMADLMLRARAYAYLERRKLADELMDKALAMVGTDGDKALFFFIQLAIIEGSPAQAMPALEAMAKKKPFEAAWLDLQIIARRFRGGEKPADLISETLSLLDRSKDVWTSYEIHRFLYQLYYTDGQFEKSAEAARAALAAMPGGPNELEILNNLAYTMIANLKDPKGGIEYAKKAVELAPASSTVLDTLGWAYYEMGELDKATETLTRAVQTAVDPGESLVAQLHLGMTLAKAGDMSGARRMLKDAEESNKKSPDHVQSLYARYMEELRTLTQ